MRINASVTLGKYRDLLFAIALFLVLDLGVLVFNFQSSRLIEADTHRIDLAGDMRVYSQQLAKAVLTLKQESVDGDSTQTSVAQMTEAYSAYQRALGLLREALDERRRELLDDHERIEQARALIVDLNRTWEPLSLAIKPLVDDASRLQSPDVGMRVNIDIAATKVVARNIRLMQQADDLARHLEGMAVHRAEQMRMIQVVAIVLALINFVFIVFKFLRNLLRSDQVATQAREEISRILGAIREGLFLLDPQGVVGSLQSASTANLLGSAFIEGTNLFSHLACAMSGEDIKAVKNYIALLFNEQVSADLLHKLNPLRVVEFKQPDGKRRFLDFEFQQIRRDGHVEFLLVSVSDITEKAGLADELARIKQTAKIEVESLLSILDHDPQVVEEFFEMADQRLKIINSQLKKFGASGAAGQSLIGQLLTMVSDIKNESSALGLHAIHASSQAFENQLETLHEKPALAGSDLILVAVVTDDLLEEVEKSRKVVARLQAFPLNHKPANTSPSSIGKVFA